MRWLDGTIALYGGLPREMYVLFIARVINRLGGFVNFILFLFLKKKLGLDLHEVGVYIALLGVFALVGTLIGGSLGDHVGRKKIYVVAQSIAAALFIPCGFLGTSMWIPVLLIISAFFSAIIQPINQAMVIDLVKKEDRKRAFSLLYFGINIGVVLGPIIAGYLFNDYIHWIFWGDAVTTFIAVFLIIKYIPETKLSHEEILEMSEDLDQNEKIVQHNAFITFLKRPILMLFTVLSMLTSFAYAQTNFALPNTIDILYGDNSSKYFGNLMSFNAIIVVVFTIVITRVSDKNKPIFNVAFANLIYGIGYGMMAFVHSMPLIVLSVFLWTMGEILGVTNSGVFVASHTPISHRSRFSAIVSFLTSIGHMLGPVLGGLLLTTYSQSQFWIFIGLLCIVAFVGLFVIGIVDKNKDNAMTVVK